jgi:hypothetical protein
MVQVVLGGTTQVFNNLNESKGFYLFVRDLSGYLVATITLAIDLARYYNYNNKKKEN